MLVVNVFALEQDRARDPRAGNRVVHAIEAAQKRRFAATGGADHRDDLPPRQINADVLERLIGAVEDTDVAAGEHRIFGADRRSTATLRRSSGAASAGMRELGFTLSPASAPRRFVSFAGAVGERGASSVGVFMTLSRTVR